jgi:hypothetical protein
VPRAWLAVQQDPHDQHERHPDRRVAQRKLQVVAESGAADQDRDGTRRGGVVDERSRAQVHDEQHDEEDHGNNLNQRQPCQPCVERSRLCQIVDTVR